MLAAPIPVAGVVGSNDIHAATADMLEMFGASMTGLGRWVR
jgi:hypothetical protein